MNDKVLTRRKFLKGTYKASIGATAVNALGLSSLLTATNTLAAEQDYKALVFIFLAGGNDSFNMVAPKGNGSLRTSYENGRRNAAIDANQLNAITPKSNVKIFGDITYNEFGLHPACADMADMFNNEEMSIVCNVGNLYEPTTRWKLLNDKVTLPPQLYSHSDQQLQFQSQPEIPFRFGWGGRLAEMIDDYNSNGNVSPLISVSGLNSFQVSSGTDLSAYVMGYDGAVKLNGVTNERKTLLESSIDSIDASSHLMMQKYRDVFSSAKRSEAIVTSAFTEAAQTGVDYDAIFTAAGASDSKIGRQLKTIAKMIAGRNSTGNNRPIYFVEMNGFDTHKKLLTNHANLMTDLNAALKAFKDVLVAQGDFDKTLSFVGSEFGRTLTPNGTDAEFGTDHAWGGHALLMGGMINGGQMFGTHPDLKLEQGLDASSGRGRWIPTTSTSQCVAKIANWFGVSQEQLPLLIPTISNFPDTFNASSNLDFFKQEINS
ncbi:DUF1501 domain-containing protein [Thalassotalea crassostreae]|uniref:DUF1501 domain-containing protein n=1 Tax=Thalassotalea crassostreae TaxID=1763536 RepID=UPI0008394ED1|nr:DUF1501 domain-containing protein [Thalassotalea crassostreae]